MDATKGRRRINPMRRPLAEGVFTDREEIMARLRRWVASVRREIKGSRVLVGPRRIGKSAVLEEFYNELFWEEDLVAPFLFEIPDEPIWERDFAINYFTQLMLQFASFLTKDPTMIELSGKGKAPELPVVRDFAQSHGLDQVVSLIDYFADLIGNVFDSELVRRAFSAPLAIASEAGKRVVVMLDEFQRLDEGVLTVDPNRERPIRAKTGGFSILADAPNAPMFVCGSAVSFMTRRVISGGLNGRFRGVWHLGPMSPEDGAELALRLARLEDVPITLDAAYKVGQLTGGNPFYIETVLRSEAPGKDLTTDAGVEAVVRYETSPGGEIYEFWRSHFQANLKALGEDTGDDTAKRVLFAVLGWEERTPPRSRSAWAASATGRLPGNWGWTPNWCGRSWSCWWRRT